MKLLTNSLFHRLSIVFTLTCFTMGLFTFAHADDTYWKNKKANKLYKQGKYDEALKIYDDAVLLSPSDAKLKMNKGSTLYKKQDFAKAEESYNGALALKDKKTLADANYDLGNALYMQGEQMLSQGGNGAQEKYQAAFEHYKKSLTLNPADKDAKWNLQLAYTRVKQMENQKKENKDDKNKDDKNNQDKNKQDQNKQDKQDKNSKDQKNQQNQNKQDQDKKQDDQNKKDQQDKQDQDKKDQNQQNQQQEQKDQQQPPKDQKSAQQKKDDMKKQEAVRLLELYSDDADSLNKPPKESGVARQRQPEKDW